jgi:hypothetical protein
VFVRFAGTAVDGLKELRSLFRGRKPGYSVPVVYLHNGEVHSTWVTLGPAHRLAHGPPPRGGVNGRR